MPFSVFGVKARLEAIDERLDELQSDLRALTHRLPDPDMRDPAAWRRAAAARDDEDFAGAPPAPARGFDRDRDRGRDRSPPPPRRAAAAAPVSQRAAAELAREPAQRLNRRAGR